jgi:hypothetical protein
VGAPEKSCGFSAGDARGATTSSAGIGGGAEDDAATENEDGATPQNRTGDTVIFSHVLYQLS